MRNLTTQRRAMRLRRQSTDAERHLWYHLRRRNLQGHRFRRQVPIGPFIADFVCLELALIVEVDGGQRAARARDEARDRYLHSRGFRILRFWNNEVMAQTEAVLEVICRHLRAPILTFPRVAGEGTL